MGGSFRTYAYIYIYIYFVVVVAKKAVVSKDIKAECKSNPFKKALIGKEEFSMFLPITNNTKNLKDKNININSNNKITSRLMVGAREGVKGYMILTERIAALPVIIVFYLYHVFLVHVFHTRVIFCIFSS